MTDGITLLDGAGFTELDEAGFLRVIAGIEREAFRFESQLTYTEPGEAAVVAAYLAGQRPDPLGMLAGLEDWLDWIAERTAAGVIITRVRVHDEPRTPYQRFVRWLDAWNRLAGERIRYITRRDAHGIGLLPAAGPDWWLLDDRRLLVMTFDDQGHRIRNILTEDPVAVQRARVWRDLAIHHSTPAEQLPAAA